MSLRIIQMPVINQQRTDAQSEFTYMSMSVFSEANMDKQYKQSSKNESQVP